MSEEEPPTEAEEYFASLDYALTSKGVVIRCDNCGYPMDKNLTQLHALSGARKCSTEMAMQIANGTASLAPELEDYIKDSPVGATPPAPAQAFAIPKPSWFQRLLDYLF